MNPKRAYFNDLAPRWDELPRPENAPALIQRFVERGGDPSARRILDVGCGTGILLPSLLETHRSAACIVELDFAEEMLQENARRHADPRIVRVGADAQALPFRNACFDLVLCFGVLPHLCATGTALRKLLRVMLPGGSISVGHLMNSAELNDFHQSLGEPVAHDRLPPVQSLAGTLREFEMTVVCAEESPGWYFVRATRMCP